MNRELDFWKDTYSKAKDSDLEILGLPRNFIELTVEQKRAIESVFYSGNIFESEEKQKDDFSETIRALRSAVWEIESVIDELELEEQE